MKKSELGSILKETVEEGLKDFLKKSPFSIGKQDKPRIKSFLELGYYNDSDTFMEDQTDDFDRYIGEEFDAFHYKKGQFIYDAEGAMHEWNEARWIQLHDDRKYVHFDNEPSYDEFLQFNKTKIDKFSSNEGVGYVYDKDMKKDPKHIPGERWRIKFDSDSKPLKENETMNINEIKSVIQELINEIWADSEENKLHPLENYLDGAGKDLSKANKGSHGINVCKKVNEIAPLPSHPFHTISRPVKTPDTGEWVVKWMIDRRRDENKTYYTDDEEDAWATYKHMVKHANEENLKAPHVSTIITAKSGPEDKYFVLNNTQGPRMVPNAYSMAKRLTKTEAEQLLPSLQKKWPGIKEWLILAVND